MEKERRRWYKKGINVIVIAIVVIVLGAGVIFASSQSIDNNALITYGFFKKQLDQLKTYIDSKINELDSKISKASNTSQNSTDVIQLQKQLSNLNLEVEKLRKQVSDLEAKLKVQAQGQGQAKSEFALTKGYEIVKVPKGKVIVFDASTEFILRVGKATATVPKGASLIDLTAAKDIGNNQQISKNHLVLIVKNDGRGFKAIDDVWVIVNGGYKIK
ncbi:hypothetical protein [Caldicellulosiruptor sp. F32]|uniref:hypothetical protein n=1 Tax=Caldicellulosiruptor sp. F32 TaxID=1214564 RepID=UPI0003A04D91|nr:hypothetical protein [Caldicellulosiruptor sp. F32]